MVLWEDYNVVDNFKFKENIENLVEQGFYLSSFLGNGAFYNAPEY